MTTLQTSELLDLSADRIQERGWQSGAGWNEPGQPLCLEGGIAAAMGITFDDLKGEDGFLIGIGDTKSNPYAEFQACPAYKAVKEYLADRRPYDSDAPLYQWNDDYAQSEDEVVEVLRAAAAVERVKEAEHAFQTSLVACPA